MLPRRAFLLSGSVLALAGCGFRPLYGGGAAANDGRVRDELAAVEIPVVPDRQGQILRNNLIRLFNPDGRPSLPRYRLSVGLTLSEVELGIRRDDTATRANLIASARYVLTDSAGAALTSGSSQAVASFNILDDEFATLTGSEDARNRALAEIAEDIRTRIAIHFVDQPAA